MTPSAKMYRHATFPAVTSDEDLLQSNQENFEKVLILLCYKKILTSVQINYMLFSFLKQNKDELIWLFNTYYYVSLVHGIRLYVIS